MLKNKDTLVKLFVLLGVLFGIKLYSAPLYIDIKPNFGLGIANYEYMNNVAAPLNAGIQGDMRVRLSRFHSIYIGGSVNFVFWANYQPTASFLLTYRHSAVRVKRWTPAFTYDFEEDTYDRIRIYHRRSLFWEAGLNFGDLGFGVHGGYGSEYVSPWFSGEIEGFGQIAVWPSLYIGIVFKVGLGISLLPFLG